MTTHDDSAQAVTYHQFTSRKFRCQCGRLYESWPKPAGYERKSRIRCDTCYRLHVRQWMSPTRKAEVTA